MFQKILGQCVIAMLCSIGLVTILTNMQFKPISYATTAIALPVVDSQPVELILNPKDVYCLALNIYFEARNQKGLPAKAAVGYVVINRMNHGDYPSSVCDVVTQYRVIDGKKRCQFSWYCDGKDNVPNLTNVVEKKAWMESKEIAMGILLDKIDNPIGNAIMYHATYVSPSWASSYRQIKSIGSHIFYESWS
jgi:spore germination cell wall hydrolase CwlJ-like protein